MSDPDLTQRDERYQLRLRNVHKSFGQHHVLRGIDLDLERHRINIIIGGSGQGKSVLCKHLMGLLKPDRGQIWVHPKLAGIHGDYHTLPPGLQHGFHQQTARYLVLSQHVARDEQQSGRSQILFCQAISWYMPRPRARIMHFLPVAALEATD